MNTPSRPEIVTKSEHLCSIQHYALLEFDTYSYDDGYGGSSTQPYVKYHQFDTKEEMIACIEKLQDNWRPPIFRCLDVKPMVATKTISVDVK